MRQNRMKIAFLGTVFLAIGSTECVQQTEAGMKVCPNSAGIYQQRYDKIFYGSAEYNSPNTIMVLDNNEKLLELCVASKTEQELQSSGVPFNESQIFLLQYYRLLRRDGRTLKTAIPLLGREKTNFLRQVMRKNAGAALFLLKKDVALFKEAMATSKHEDASFTVLFSYILDSLVWERFAEKGIRAEEKPGQRLWNGAVWMLSPSRNFHCGTNSISKGTMEFKLNWSKVAKDLLGPVLSNWGLFEKMALEILDNQRITKREVFEAFGEFGIFDSAGRSQIAVIEESPQNALFVTSRRLSEKIGDHFLATVDLDRLRKELELPSLWYTVVVSYHEWMWEFLDQLEKNGLVQKPLVFREPHQVSKKEVGNLVFLVKSAPILKLGFIIDKDYDRKTVFSMLHQDDPAGLLSRARSLGIDHSMAQTIHHAKDYGEVEGLLDQLIEERYSQVNENLRQAQSEYTAIWANIIRPFSEVITEVTGHGWFHPEYTSVVSAFHPGISNWYGNIIATKYNLNPMMKKRIVAHELLLSHAFHLVRTRYTKKDLNDWEVWAFSEITAVLIMTDSRLQGYWPEFSADANYFSKSNYPQLASLEGKLRAIYKNRKSFVDYVEQAVPILHGIKK